MAAKTLTNILWDTLRYLPPAPGSFGDAYQGPLKMHAAILNTLSRSADEKLESFYMAVIIVIGEKYITLSNPRMEETHWPYSRYDEINAYAYVRFRNAAGAALVIKLLAYFNVRFVTSAQGLVSRSGFVGADERCVVLDFGWFRWLEPASRLYGECHDFGRYSTGSKPPWSTICWNLEHFERAGDKPWQLTTPVLIAGGGIPYFPSIRGLACDNVREFEVVCGDGRVVMANARNEHSNLFKALKGGGANFGIVIRVILNTTPNITQVFERYSQFDRCDDDLVAKAFADHITSMDRNVGVRLGAKLRVHSKGSDAIRWYGHEDVSEDHFEIIPTQKRTDPEASKHMYEHVIDTKPRETLSATTCDVKPRAMTCTATGTLTVRNDAKTYADLINKFRKTKLVPKGVHVRLYFQPLKAAWVEECGAKNIMNFEPVDQSIIAIVAMWSRHREADTKRTDSTPSEQQSENNSLRVQGSTHESGTSREKPAVPKYIWTKTTRGKQVGAMMPELIKELQTAAGENLLPILHMNDAWRDQDVLGSYGAKNVGVMKWVSREYDPERVFQRLQWSGFLLERRPNGNSGW